MISPLLANIYLHYVYDLWVQAWRRRHATGSMIVVRYADDTIVGFQHRTDAERFLHDLKERLAEFALNLHPEKTRLIEFGRYAAGDRARRGEGKPEAFDFLGEAQTERGNTPENRGGAASHPAFADRRAGALAGNRAQRALRLLRSSDQPSGGACAAQSRHDALVPESTATEPEASADLVAHECHCREIPAATTRPASMARATLPRQPPEVGAVCVNCARTDLRGGRSAMSVPTATQSKEIKQLEVTVCANCAERYSALRAIE